MIKKHFLKISAVMVIAVMMLGVVSMIPVSAQKPEKEPVDKVVFIHYPKKFENRPDITGVRLENANGKPNKTINCPDPNTCSDYKYSGIRWATMPVHYVIDATNKNGISASSVKTAIEKGFSSWSAVDPTATFIDDNSNAAILGDPTTSRDNLNSALFRDMSAKYPNALAVTFVWYARFTKRIVETDTVFNEGFNWSYTDPSTVLLNGLYGDYGSTGLSTYDIGNIAIHEQGHWLMLNDLYNSRDTELTMYGYGAPAEMKKISLGLGDKLGILKIY
ncbi:hypothetical protein HY227_00285 [Candidatus Wolfebacteria bacterium]|nr:hypothetical protein [Candidatus Wolfebacteria bacterium]